MTLKSLLSACALVVASATAGSAATYNLGDVTLGASTSNTLVKQTVDFIDFSYDAPVGFGVSNLEISVTSVPGSNFRELIALYSGGSLVAKADGGVGGGGGTATLSFNGFGVPAEGAYTLAIGGWKSDFTPDIADVKSTAFFNNGNYTLTIGTTISEVPLPAGGLLMLTGLGALALTRRKARVA